MKFKKGLKRAEVSNLIDIFVNGTVGQVSYDSVTADLARYTSGEPGSLSLLFFSVFTRNLGLCVFSVFILFFTTVRF